MELILQNSLSAIVNVLLFSAIPFIWWFIRRRKEISFLNWIGLTKPRLKGKWWTLIIFFVVYYIFYNTDFFIFTDEEAMNELMENSDAVAANVYTGLGVAAIIPGLIQNYICNGLAEEILFRGFINKRLSNKFGSVKGVIIQGVLFGLMHNILYILAGIPVDFGFHIGMFISTGGAAVFLAVLNEKIFNKSIIPSVLFHGTNNFLGTIQIAFGL